MTLAQAKEKEVQERHQHIKEQMIQHDAASMQIKQRPSNKDTKEKEKRLLDQQIPRPAASEEAQAAQDLAVATQDARIKQWVLKGAQELLEKTQITIQAAPVPTHNAQLQSATLEKTEITVTITPSSTTNTQIIEDHQDNEGNTRPQHECDGSMAPTQKATMKTLVMK